MIKLITMGIIILLFSISVIAEIDTYMLTVLQKDTIEQTLDLVKNNKENYEKVLKLLNDKEVDLSNEIELSNRIRQEALSLGVNTEQYNKIKFSDNLILSDSYIEQDKISLEKSNSGDITVALFIIAILILGYLIYRFKIKKSIEANKQQWLKLRLSTLVLIKFYFRWTFGFKVNLLAKIVLRRNFTEKNKEAKISEDSYIPISLKIKKRTEWPPKMKNYIN